MVVNNLWDDQDFFINRFYWANKSKASIKIRKENLSLMSNILSNLNIFNFLEGKTLLYLYVKKELSIFDTDDDIGVFFKDYKIIKNNLDIFKKNGFNLIRDNYDLISFERNFRYIDICLFQDLDSHTIGYSKKKFNRSYYEQFEHLKFNKHVFNIPNNTKEYLSQRYFNEFPKNYLLRKNKKKLKNNLISLYELLLPIFDKNINKIPIIDQKEFNNTQVLGKYTVDLTAKDLYIRNLFEDRKATIPYIESTHFKIFNSIKQNTLNQLSANENRYEILQKLQNLMSEITSKEKNENYVIVEYDKFFKRRYLIFSPSFIIKEQFNNNFETERFIIL